MSEPLTEQLEEPGVEVDPTSETDPSAVQKSISHGIKDSIVVEGEGPVSQNETGFRFGRMFNKAAFQPVVLRMTTCRAVGDQMTSVPEVNRGESQLPAGYTYFGQFVDHDISFDGTKPDREGDNPATNQIEITPDMDLIQERSPSLDLDSLYGGSVMQDAAFFSGAKFKIGTTSPTPGFGDGPVHLSLRYDLPRHEASGPGPRAALIGDPRNEENLAVAQTHLMWLKFHNQIVDRLRIQSPATPEVVLFNHARDLTTRHYQHVVLHDYVRRIIQEDVYKDIIVDGNRKVLEHAACESAFMPLEFSVAAYRFGHSLVREVYDWNINFGTGGEADNPTNFRELFRFTAASGDMRGLPTLPSNWIPSFARLYDFGDAILPHLTQATMGPVNFAKKIDPFLAPALGRLPEAPGRPFDNLAALNLRRGSMRGLPSGQDVSRMLHSVKMLSKAQMRSVISPDFDQVMENSGLYERTPLWLYVLMEAAALENGERMGPMGSIILADTFRTLVLTSRTSILRNDAPWHPADALDVMGGGTGLETIPQILLWMDATEAIIDPLQDSRIQAAM